MSKGTACQVRRHLSKGARLFLTTPNPILSPPSYQLPIPAPCTDRWQWCVAVNVAVEGVHLVAFPIHVITEHVCQTRCRHVARRVEKRLPIDAEVKVRQSGRQLGQPT